MVKLIWEDIEQDRGFYLYRAKVPGGWLVALDNDVLEPERNFECGWQWRTSIAFVPDPLGMWK